MLVGSVRGLGNINRQLALDLGFKFLPELPDMRVIRTMVSFLDDTTEKKKIFNVLKYAKDKNYVRNVRNSIVKIPDIESKFSALPPWTFEMTETVKLGKKPIFFKHEFDQANLQIPKGLRLSLRSWDRSRLQKLHQRQLH